MIQNAPGSFYVLRTHSGAGTQKVTYQLTSRPFDDIRSAESWARYIAKSESKKNQEVFVVRVENICFEGKSGERLTKTEDSV